MPSDDTRPGDGAPGDAVPGGASPGAGSPSAAAADGPPGDVVEWADEPLDPSVLGPLIARGRDAEVFALGDDRVARRLPTPRDLSGEAAVMEHVRAAGYPVPRVWRVAPGEVVLERVEGPTMLEDLGAHPWRVDAHARTLAGLHRRLHAIPAPPDLPAHPWPGDAVLHLDLHPGNVMLTADGPVVIDWPNARRGGAGADVALTWIIVAVFAADRAPSSALGRARDAVVGLVEGRIRRRLVDRFLAAAGRDDAVAALAATARERLDDPHVRPEEADAIRALVLRETGQHL